MSEKIFCQSCGMPMTKEEHFASNADGSKNEDYCCYCFKEGEFTSDCSMDEMIEFCLNCEGSEEWFPDKELGRKQMQEWFPSLKRWKEA
ncbi:zinc ribbon domain-containing protein [Clostridium sp. Marseille-P299]|uniref:zinc ribbon domain-containing protein n=1 Tax=Clostridium sp. Marseille-P299 TaxID=1805477 RepID=UPI00082FC253|nr:zinc ribbon domain-containing protein [Clostridium sp. Marseille-P299]